MPAKQFGTTITNKGLELTNGNGNPFTSVKTLNKLPTFRPASDLLLDQDEAMKLEENLY